MEAGLLDAGFVVTGIAASAEEALRLAGAERPDLVVMDIRLSGKRDGTDAARQIFERHGIRSLMATAHYDEKTRGRADPAAAAGWLPKPFTIPALVTSIRAALTESKPRS